MSLIAERRRRNVIQGAIGYLAASWVMLQVIALLAESGWPQSQIARAATVGLRLLFIAALIVAWYHGKYGLLIPSSWNGSNSSMRPLRPPTL